MLIDGVLSEADSGKTFDNVNPATARRAFDETDWSSDHRLRQRFLEELQQALERSLSVARPIRTGSLSVNGGAPYGADLPFGGYRNSGMGRQNGAAGFEQYTEIKSVACPKDAT